MKSEWRAKQKVICASMDPGSSRCIGHRQRVPGNTGYVFIVVLSYSGVTAWGYFFLHEDSPEEAANRNLFLTLSTLTEANYPAALPSLHSQSPFVSLGRDESKDTLTQVVHDIEWRLPGFHARFQGSAIPAVMAVERQKRTTVSPYILCCSKAMIPTRCYDFGGVFPKVFDVFPRRKTCSKAVSGQVPDAHSRGGVKALIACCCLGAE
ncbi:hypothetical protein C8R47DRAFT_1085567 [Mycena vitilis]|nr:hypothetical protein C8R47DRAFT_1085567 [Mycena vitilis]